MFLITKKRLVSSFSVTFLFTCSFILYHYPIAQSYTSLTIKTTTIYNIQRVRDDISCHDIYKGDALLSAEDASFSPPADSIFFHETSCRGWLSSRQACAIESAAKTHPWRKIYVLFSGPIPKSILHFIRNSLTELQRYPNIEFARVHATEYARGSQLEQLFSKRMLNASKWKVYHTSDLLRVITMFKFGGLYLDTDTIVIKPMDDLGRNWVARESDEQVSSGAMNVAKDQLGQDFIRQVLTEISTSFKPDLWLYNGPGALGRVLSKFCNTTIVKEFSKSTCNGLQVYGPEFFYPVPYLSFRQLFEIGCMPEADNAYSFHLWNYLSQDLEVQRESPVDQLAKQHCPIIWELYKDNFGF